MTIDAVNSLRSQELEVVTLLACGLSKKAIEAEMSFTQPSSLKNMVTVISTTLGVHNRAAIVGAVLGVGRIELPVESHGAVLWWMLTDNRAWRDRMARLAASGLSLEEISRELRMSRTSLKSVLSGMYAVLGCGKSTSPKARLVAVGLWAVRVRQFDATDEAVLRYIAGLLQDESKRATVRHSLKEYLQEVAARLSVSQEAALTALTQAGRMLAQDWKRDSSLL